MKLSEFALLSPTDRLQYVYGESTKEECDAGASAYSRYNYLLTKIAARTSTSVKVACGVFSALSPNNDYLGNLKDAARLLDCHARMGTIHMFKVHTYGANKWKAWAIACGRDPFQAPKTRNFYHNLLDPKDPRYVTIDGHMANIYLGQKLPLQTRNPDRRAVSVSKKLYDEIARDVKSLAEWNAYLPNQMQAILWLTWKRLHGIKSSPQLTFWDLDVESAGLGFERVAV